MDVTLMPSSVYDLPSKQRVGAIIYDGACDMQLWPGPGPDSLLKEAWGDGLQDALDLELEQVPGGKLAIPDVCRVTPGRLHCDFLAWAATRGEEPGSKRQPAPDKDLLFNACIAALEFVAKRSVTKVAFSALGGGRNELPPAERLEVIVKAAHAYHEKCYAEGRAPVVEEVLVCEPLAKVFREAREKVSGMAKAATKKATKKTTKKATKKRATKKRAPKKPVGLTEEEVEAAKAVCKKFSLKTKYIPGDFINHSKFGMGRVEEILENNAIKVLFHDGVEKHLAHNR